MSTSNVVAIRRDRSVVDKKVPTFHVSVTKTSNHHKAQMFLDYGNDPGPWVKIGMNNTCYGFGYLPQKKKTKSVKSAIKEHLVDTSKVGSAVREES